MRIRDRIQKEGFLMKDDSSLVMSYMTLRKIVGILGILLPFVLWLGALLLFQEGPQSSISAYYYTKMRNVMVGVLWATGVFLYAYRGYDRRDDIAGNLACLFAIGVTLFPTAPDGAADSYILLIDKFHLACAALFFLTLTYFCLFLFTQSDKKKLGVRKRQRNLIYQICGYLILACIVLMAVYSFLPDGTKAPLVPLRPIFWLETFAILAYGVSWFVKGEAILKDQGREKKA